MEVHSFILALWQNSSKSSERLASSYYRSSALEVRQQTIARAAIPASELRAALLNGYSNFPIGPRRVSCYSGLYSGE